VKKAYFRPPVNARQHDFSSNIRKSQKAILCFTSRKDVNYKLHATVLIKPTWILWKRTQRAQ